MTSAARWVVWRAEQHGDLVKKVPYMPAYPNRRASATDRASWGTFDEAMEAVQNDESLTGVGFVLGDGWCGFDHDDASTAVQRQPFIGQLPSYAEVSQSGRGFHVIFKGALPGKNLKVDDMEMYDGERFFVVTGDHIEGTPSDVQTLSVEQVTPVYQSIADRGVVATARKRSGALDAILTNPASLGAYGSESERDMAIAGALAMATSDARQVARIMRSLPTSRAKYDVDDYLSRTITKALSSKPTTDALDVTDESKFERLVEKKLAEMRIVQEAKRRFAIEFQNDQTPRTGAPVSFDAFMSTADEPIAWIVDGLVQNGDVLFVWGPPKAGKSSITCDAAVAVATGTEWAGQACRKGKVLYLPYEAPESLRPRFAGALAQRGRPVSAVQGRIMVDAMAPFLGDDAEVERYAATKIDPHDYSLVVVDTLTMAAHGMAIDDGSKADAGKVMRALRTLCPKNGAVLVIHHCGVDTSRLRGATSMLAAVDGEIKVTKGQVETGNMRHAESGAFKVAFDIISNQQPPRLGVGWSLAERLLDGDEALKLKVDEFMRANDNGTVKSLRAYLGCSTGRASALRREWCAENNMTANTSSTVN